MKIKYDYVYVFKIKFLFRRKCVTHERYIK